MTPALPLAGASIQRGSGCHSRFFICPNAERLWNIFERWHPHEQKEQPQHTPVSVSRRRPAQAETQENGAEGSKIPPQLYPRCTPSDGAAEGTGDVIDKDLFLISEKLQKLTPEQLRLVEDLIDACTDYFKGASGKD